MKLTAKGYDGLYELRYKGDKAVPARIVKTIQSLEPPHRPGTSGRIYFKPTKRGGCTDRLYASGVGCFYKRVIEPKQGRTAQVIGAQHWNCESGQVVNQNGDCVLRVNRGEATQGRRVFDPCESDALTMALAWFPELFKAADAMTRARSAESIKTAKAELLRAVKGCQSHDRI